MQCYQLEIADIARFAIEFMQERGNKLNYDDAICFAGLLSPNLMMIERELEKLELLAFDKLEISSQDIERSTNGETILNIDEIFFNFLTNPSKAIILIESMIIQDNLSDLILLLRSMQNLAKKLISIKIMLKNGESFDSAVMKLKPPVFFKFRQKFMHLERITSLSQLKTILTQLNMLEKKVKLSTNNTVDQVGSYFISKTL